MKRILYTLLLVFSLLVSAWADGDRYASQSVLNTGKWIKIQVEKDGIYKLTLSDLKKMGFSSLDKVAIYGYGGWQVDEDFSKTYIDDLPEVAVWKGADYLLFYGRGPVKWQYSGSKDGFTHTNNPYSNYGYYFVTEKDVAGRVMEKAASADGATLQITTFDDYVLHEKELAAVNNSGRELYGESFESALSQNFTVSVPGITNDAGKASLSFIARASGSRGNVTMSIDGNPLISGIFNTTSDEYVSATAVNSAADWTTGKSEKVNVTIQYNTKGHKNMRLNYFRLQMKRQLKVYANYTFFRSLAASGNASRFVIQGGDANTLVFDITDGIHPLQMETRLSGTEVSFSIPAASALREFVAVQPSQIKAPETVGEVANQNLHALPQQDMIIIAQPGLTSQAERLAEAHRTKDNLTVRVVAPEAIYNEFSSGTPDASAYRRFMKMFFDRKTSEAGAPKYLLLFGDGSFDNRKLTANWQSVDMRNMLLTYQTENSLDSYSYVVDDYFGFLDDADDAIDISGKKMDLGIGRFPVRTLAEATIAVDKVISYMNNDGTGSWKNNVCFIADDGSNADNFDTIHQVDANKTADIVEETNPSYVVSKVFFDAYKKSTSGGLASYPDVNTLIKKKLKEGLFLINYTGHGGTTSLSDEKVITQNDIMQADYDNLPIWITGTCDFCPFDASVTSAGESVFLNKKSGGIALFTTTRVAYTNTNANINTQLIRSLFENRAQSQTLGGVLKDTKNSIGFSARKLGFSLIGDPALRIAYPHYQMAVTSINGKDVSEGTSTLKALGKVVVKGKLYAGGSEQSDFNGTMYATVFDNRASVTTLGNNIVQGVAQKVTYDDYPNVLYKGNGVVSNGEFEFSFIVPKDISYSAENFGKMSLYALDATTGNEAQGAFLDFVVGGTSDTAETDTIGPEIRALYLNDSTFVDGGQVNASPYFVAELWDKSGVNMTGSSLGHDMMLIIDDSPLLSYNLNSYYELLPGQDGAGIVRFAIPTLAPGIHQAELWVWDIHNNSTVHTFSFEVVEGLKPFIVDIVATPSPAREQVTFHLFHNRPESRMKVGIMVYDLTGRLYWKHEETGTSDLFKAYTVTWNLTNGAGAPIHPGIYIYRAAISTDGSKEATKAKKLIILAQ